MIIKMSLVTSLYVVITAALWLWVHGKMIRMTNGKRILIGVLYGICAILSTHFGVVYETMTLNVRDIAPLAAGMFFDPAAGIIAGLIGGIERFIVGEYFGIGQYTRVACSVSTCLAGFLAAAMNRVIFKGKKPTPFYAFFMGAVMEVFHMYVVFITHRNDMNMAFYVVDVCAKPMIIFTGIGLAASSVVLYLLSGRLRRLPKRPHDEDVPISVKFQVWLFICTMIMLMFTFTFSYSMQTKTNMQNTNHIMTINSEDAKTAYSLLSDDYKSLQELIKEQTLVMAHAVASAVDYFGGIHNMPVEGLESMCRTYDFYEINLIEKNGNIISSSNPLNVNFDMYSTDQSRPFMDITDKNIGEFVQDYRPIGRDSKVSLMYAGVKCVDGIVQVALDDKQIEKYGSTDEYEAMFGDRHVGENGAIYIYDDNSADKVILLGEQKGKTLSQIGVNYLSKQGTPEVYYFEADVLGISSYCRCENYADGFGVLATMPITEVYRSRDMAAYETAFADILLFTLIFLLIYILVQKIIVDNLNRINTSLGKITKGNLDEIVNVRASSEFASLSEDINLTVQALKGYIEQAEKRIEEELEFAREIQFSALPQNFDFPRKEFQLYASMDPAKEVGGDFYDFFFVDKNKIALVIADVSGKGIPAALFMMRSKTAIKSLAESGSSPGKIFEKANNALCEGNDADMFVTAWIGIVDLETGKVQCANAGHEYPAIKRADGQWELIHDKHGLALAAMEDMPFKEYELQLNPGDKLYVYTDGVPEAINEQDEQYGTDEMLRSLNAANTRTMRELLPFIRKRISSFVGNADQFDDITMLGFEFKQFMEK